MNNQNRERYAKEISVHQKPTVAVLYRDEKDRSNWEYALHGVPGLLPITVNRNDSIALARLRRAEGSLRLVVISSRLYPCGDPGLARRVRAAAPGFELLVISPSGEPSPPLTPLLLDRVRHLAFNPPQDAQRAADYLPLMVCGLVHRRPWEIGSCLREGTVLHRHQLRSSDDKEALVGALEAALAGEGPELEMLRHKGALLADELLENALYDAPRGPDGARLFRKGERRELLPQESIVLSFGFDGETLALKLTDSWGSLAPEVVLEHLAKNQDSEVLDDDTGGRGLFIIWRFLDQFHLNVQPGLETAVGGHLQLSSGLDPDLPRGYHITQLHQGEAA
jgi:hypothetical protein